MKGIRLGMAMIAVVGLAGGGAPAASAQSEYNQCYRRPQIDPEGACTACFNICMGAGFVCCQITPIAPNVPG